MAGLIESVEACAARRDNRGDMQGARRDGAGDNPGIAVGISLDSQGSRRASSRSAPRGARSCNSGSRRGFDPGSPGSNAPLVPLPAHGLQLGSIPARYFRPFLRPHLTRRLFSSGR